MLEQTGASFPFRIGVRGGVVMSSTSHLSVPHIEEGMAQRLLTNRMERAMDNSVWGDIDTFIFDANDSSTRTMLVKQVVTALKLDPRIEVRERDIDVYSIDEVVYADIKYKVVMYDTYYQNTFEI